MNGNELTAVTKDIWQTVQTIESNAIAPSVAEAVSPLPPFGWLRLHIHLCRRGFLLKGCA